MKSTSASVDIAKFANFQWKNADISRFEEVCHVILKFFGISLGLSLTVPLFIITGYKWQIFGCGDLFAPPPPPFVSSLKKAHPE